MVSRRFNDFAWISLFTDRLILWKGLVRIVEVRGSVFLLGNQADADDASLIRFLDWLLQVKQQTPWPYYKALREYYLR